MDFDKYKNTMAYPSLSHTKAAILAELDNVPMTKAQRIDAEQNASKVAKARHHELLADFHAEERRLTDLFFADAHDELGIGYLPKTVLDKLDAMAWDRGHSAGYHEVWNALQDLAELAQLAYGVGQAMEEFRQKGDDN